ncbi:MAG: hypothetical protein K0S53_265 [Bacteroidetes bacterium]|jgi:uncharacterized protein (DUF1697 family)|nr:hypothetical protein [Bacteroidota bacterium]MDF2452787.1 hypothetical protein [Bacteroidota bacterium]
MKTYIAILRGINVSGHKPVKMEALRNLCEELGLKNTKTYIQSGNIVFQSKNTKLSDLESTLSKKIEATFGFDVPVMVKKAEEIQYILKNNPFLTKRKEDITKLHVTFLNQEPDKTSIDTIKEGQYASDEFMIKDKAIYLFCPNGYGNTKLSNTFFENKLKVMATTRNWKTITELVNISEEIINA